MVTFSVLVLVNSSLCFPILLPGVYYLLTPFTLAKGSDSREWSNA